MSVFTETEIKQHISEITSAMTIVRSGGKSYNLNDGQGSQQVTRSTLKELRDDLEYWRAELEDLTGSGNVVALGGGRHGY